MALVVPDHGAVDALRFYVNQSQPQDLVLRLFVNDVAPAPGDAAGRFVEPQGFGYAAVRLKGADWEVVDPPAPAAGQPRTAPYARARQQAFTFTGPLGDVYGYYLTRAGSGRIAHAERFAAGPIRVVNNGDRIRITARIQFQTAKA